MKALVYNKPLLGKDKQQIVANGYPYLRVHCILGCPIKDLMWRYCFSHLKNSSIVSHYAYCYGNFPDTVAILLQFDTNVVSSADYFRDYEELWIEQAKESPSLRRMIINSSTSQKGYYIESINDNESAEGSNNNSIEYIIP